MNENSGVVDFNLLLKLANDRNGARFDEIIMALELQEVPMSPAVRELGKVVGILYA